MTCEHCEERIKKALKKIGGVHGVEVDLESKEVKISYDSTDAHISAIKKAIEVGV
jgi:copper chaperone CopZ